MSALLEKPVTTTKQRVSKRVKQAFAPAQHSTPIASLTIERTHAKPKSNVLVTLCLRVVLFGVVGYSTFAASSICGQMKLESARQDRKQAIAKASDAKVAVEQLTRQIDQQTSSANIERWALAKGFISPDGLDMKDGKNLVAHR
ncbi:hypothetical protein BH11ARM1_BH11ARM1_04340 [soil metagenome]